MKRTFIIYTVALLISGFIFGYLFGNNQKSSLPQAFACEEIDLMEMPTSDVELAESEKEFAEQIEVEKIIKEEIFAQKKNAGTFELTAYCGCVNCCGKSDAITATGTRATQGRTIAVDPKVIPYGTEVVINGHTYIAEDCGGAIGGNRIDIYFENHQDAINFGRQSANVEIKY